MIYNIIILVLISIFITILDFVLDIISWIKESKSNITLGDYIEDREEILGVFVIPIVNLVSFIVLLFLGLRQSSLNLRKLLHYE